MIRTWPGGGTAPSLMGYHFLVLILDVTILLEVAHTFPFSRYSWYMRSACSLSDRYYCYMRSV